jgi:hypothetical protein
MRWQKSDRWESLSGEAKMKGGNHEISPLLSCAAGAEIGSRDEKKQMEKQDVPNARDEIRKLQNALKGKAEDSSFADGIRAKKTRVGGNGQNANGIKSNGKVNQANTQDKDMKE